MEMLQIRNQPAHDYDGMIVKKQQIVREKIQFFKKTSWNKFHYPIYWKSCDMIAMKREVAAEAKK